MLTTALVAPKHEHALLYRTTPLHALAYPGTKLGLTVIGDGPVVTARGARVTVAVVSVTYTFVSP